MAVVATAAVFPATGTAADVLDVVTKIAIGLLFLLYGARLSPVEALHGLRHWRLHLQLLLPFVAAGGTSRLRGISAAWLGKWVHRHPVVTKAFDRGSILIVVYTAFSMSMAEHVWSTVSPWRVVAVAGVWA